MDLAFTLNAFGAVAGTFETYLGLSTFDGNIAIGFDTLRRYASLRVFLTFASGNDTDDTVVDVDLVVAVDTFSASACRQDVHFAAIDSHDAVGLDA